ncbi:hypothetical protein ES705_50438 [subsurface metagenome]
MLNVLREKIQKNSIWKIRKFRNDEDCKRNRPYEVKTFKGNCLLNEGINELWTILCSAGGTKWDSANAYLGVGDSSSDEDAAQTGLQAVTNKLYKVMEDGFPTYGTNQKASWKAIFGSADANWAWNEFTVSNSDSDAGKNLNRKVSSQGTKQSGQTWELTLEITLS